jgi:hypothetical protein
VSEAAQTERPSADPVQSINLNGLTPAQLIKLRERIDAELAARWRP